MDFRLFREKDVTSYWLIEKRVNELAVLYEKEDGSIPIRIEKIIRILRDIIKVDIKLELLPIRQKDGNPYGRLHHDDNNSFKIVVGEYDHISEQRFTICHEIGHIFVGGSDWWDERKNKKFISPFNNYWFIE